MKYRVSGILLLLLALTACGERVFRGYLQQGLDRYAQGDFAGAYEKWYVLAQQGNADAQINIGDLYLNGLGIRSNPKAALGWYEKAAKQGSLRTLFALGNLYAWDGEMIFRSDIEKLSLAIIDAGATIYDENYASFERVTDSGFNVRG